MNVIVDGGIYARQPHGGISRCFTSLLCAFAERQDVRVLLSLPAGAKPPEELNGLHVEQRPAVKPCRPQRLFRHVNRWRADALCKKYWGQFKEGVYHASYYTTHEGLRVPQILTFQDAIYERFPSFFDDAKGRQHIENKRQCVAHADAVVFPSEFSRAECRALYTIDDKLTAVIPYAVNPAFLSRPLPGQIDTFRQKFAGGKHYMLHSGGRYFHKNFSRLIEAYARWDGRERFRLLNVGGGPLQADEKRQISDLGLEDRVSAVPRLSEEDLVCAYYAAAGFIFPSLSEGYGFPLIEAMATGLPVMAARAGSLPEVGRDVPVYCDPGSVESIVNGLTELADVLDARERWQHGRQVAKARTWNNVAEEYVKLYQEVALHG